MNSTVIRRTKLCRLKLIELAQSGDRMTYTELRRFLGLSQRARLSTYLDRVYECEVRCFGRPEITLILHPDGKLHGPFISRGRRARSRRVTPKNRKEYGRELRNVYAYWGGNLHRDVAALLK